MSWISNLYEIYDTCQSLVGLVTIEGKTPLLPIGHTTQNANVEVILDGEGNFLRANRLDKPETTIIPCTEDSSSRSGSAEFPHPLFDKLQYVAGDYRFYGGTKGKKSYELYIENLEKWCLSSYKHKKVESVYKYLKKANLISDLIKEKVIIYDDNTKKIEDLSQLDYFVRFRVQIFGDLSDDLSLDRSIWISYIDYYLSIQDSIDRCYVSGEIVPITEKHSKKIRNTGDSAKLISSNDSSGFTFLGKFNDKNQAVSVGYETSQKVFNALRWLVDMYGYQNDSQAIVAFNNENKEIPSAWEDDDLLYEPDDSVPFANINQDYSLRLRESIAGYKQTLDHASRITIIGLDSATPGRLSIFYYRELFSHEYLEKIQNWYDSCYWLHRYKFNVDKKPYDFIGTPSPKEIALGAYGKRADKGIVKETIERLLPCIFDGRSLPRDLVLTITRRASNPQSMEKYEWNKVISIACALNKKFFEKENLQMALDEKISDRSYLFGRLLAVADKIESMTFEKGDDRQTNAMRYMSMFAQNPFRTWEIVWKKLIPYISKLGGRGYRYQNLISEIMTKFDFGEYSRKESLDGKYLLGFHCQRQVFINEMKEIQLKKIQEKMIEESKIEE